MGEQPQPQPPFDVPVARMRWAVAELNREPLVPFKAARSEDGDTYTVSVNPTRYNDAAQRLERVIGYERRPKPSMPFWWHLSRFADTVMLLAVCAFCLTFAVLCFQTGNIVGGVVAVVLGPAVSFIYRKFFDIPRGHDEDMALHARSVLIHDSRKSFSFANVIIGLAIAATAITLMVIWGITL